MDGKQLLAAMERRDTIEEELKRLAHETEHHHHHGEECHDPECSCHHHDHDHGEHEHHHEHGHHHHHGEECHDPDCSCHHHDHDHGEHEHHHEHGHHHHHHADEVFVSVGAETTKKFDAEELEKILAALDDRETYGFILRSKGIVEGKDGKWIHFDYVPGEPNVREGSAGIIGRLCVIGSNICRHSLEELFGVAFK